MGTLNELEADQPEKATVDRAEFPAFIAKQKQRSATDINLEITRLAMGPGSLSFDEYVFYRFYDPEVATPEEKRRFIGGNLHWPLTSKVSDVAYDALSRTNSSPIRSLGRLDFRSPRHWPS